MSKLPNKPSWGDAPEWADGLGIADWECDYKGEWCWIADRESDYFINIEPRPIKETIND